MALRKAIPLISITLSALYSGTLAADSSSLGKRQLLADRQLGSCHDQGWIPACSGAFACVPPGGVCCSDGMSYAMPPDTCPDGNTGPANAGPDGGAGPGAGPGSAPVSDSGFSSGPGYGSGSDAEPDADGGPGSAPGDGPGLGPASGPGFSPGSLVAGGTGSGPGFGTGSGSWAVVGNGASPGFGSGGSPGSLVAGDTSGSGSGSWAIVGNAPGHGSDTGVSPGSGPASGSGFGSPNPVPIGAPAPEVTGPPQQAPPPQTSVGADFLGYGSQWYTFALTYHVTSHYYSQQASSPVLVSTELTSCTTIAVSATDKAQASAALSQWTASALLPSPTPTPETAVPPVPTSTWNAAYNETFGSATRAPNPVVTAGAARIGGVTGAAAALLGMAMGVLAASL